MRSTITDEDIRNAMYDMLVKKGVTVVSASNLAEHLQCSTSTIHRIMRQHCGAVPRTGVANSYDRTIRWSLDRTYLAEKLADLHKQLDKAKGFKIA